MRNLWVSLVNCCRPFFRAAREIATSRAALYMYIATMAFWIVAFFVPSPTLIIGLSYIGLIVSVAVFYAYFPNVLNAIRYGTTAAQQLLLGITLMALTVIELRGWSTTVRIFGLEFYLKDSYFIPFVLYQVVWAQILHLIPGAVQDELPGQRRIWVGVVIAVALFVAGIVVAFNLEDRYLNRILAPPAPPAEIVR